MKVTIREAMARAIYESSEFKKPWDHPDTVRLWHPVCMRQAGAALKAYHKAIRKVGEGRA